MGGGAGGADDADKTSPETGVTPGLAWWRVFTRERLSQKQLRGNSASDYEKNQLPTAGPTLGWEGETEISFQVNRYGLVFAIEIISSSGYEVLDEQVIKALKIAAPFAHAPEDVRFRMPVSFQLQ